LLQQFDLVVRADGGAGDDRGRGCRHGAGRLLHGVRWPAETVLHDARGLRRGAELGERFGVGLWPRADRDHLVRHERCIELELPIAAVFQAEALRRRGAGQADFVDGNFVALGG
jgi:hypothetical protein